MVLCFYVLILRKELLFFIINSILIVVILFMRLYSEIRSSFLMAHLERLFSDINSEMKFKS